MASSVLMCEVPHSSGRDTVGQQQQRDTTHLLFSLWKAQGQDAAAAAAIPQVQLRVRFRGFTASRRSQGGGAVTEHVCALTAWGGTLSGFTGLKGMQQKTV